MNCRVGCGACCIAPSISTSIPGMPNSKPAGGSCVQSSDDNRCKIFGQSDRPEVCVRLRPAIEMCGQSTEEAMAWLTELECGTQPFFFVPRESTI